MLVFIKRAFFLILGVLFVFLAVLGIFLPLLPTTPFLLLAVYCFARSSKRLHSYLLNNRYFGPAIKDWQQYRCINRSVKIKASCFIVLSFLVSIYFVNLILLQMLLVGMMTALLYFIWQTASERK